MRIKAVVFDFGGTLAEGELQTAPFEAELLQYLRSLGYQVWLTDLRASQRASLSRLERVRASHRELSFEEVYTEVLIRLYIPPEEETLNHLYELYCANFAVTLLPGVEDLLRGLSDGYKLAVLSNTLSDMPRRFLASQGLADLFKAIVCSKDLGIRKPDERTFMHVLEEVEAAPSEAVFVGDTLKEDVEGAGRVGMTTVWVKKGNMEETPSECEHPPRYTITTVLELSQILREIEEG